MCECDRAFGEAIRESNFDQSMANKKADKNGMCRKPQNHTAGPGRCCKSKNDLFAWFNSNTHLCCDGNVAKIGLC